jgi:hypothetical protein
MWSVNTIVVVAAVAAVVAVVVAAVVAVVVAAVAGRIITTIMWSVNTIVVAAVVAAGRTKDIDLEVDSFIMRSDDDNRLAQNQ